MPYQYNNNTTYLMYWFYWANWISSNSTLTFRMSMGPSRSLEGIMAHYISEVITMLYQFNNNNNKCIMSAYLFCQQYTCKLQSALPWQAHGLVDLDHLNCFSPSCCFFSLKRRFLLKKKKISGNVELCLLILPSTFFPTRNVPTSSGSISGIYFEPSGVL